jgi:hypothetical protein
MYTDKNEQYKYVEISSNWRRISSRRFVILFSLSKGQKALSDFGIILFSKNTIHTTHYLCRLSQFEVHLNTAIFWQNWKAPTQN